MKDDENNIKGENSNNKSSKKESEQAEMNALSAEVEATLKSGNQAAIDALKAKLQRVQGGGTLSANIGSNYLESLVDKEKEEEQRKKHSEANINPSPTSSSISPKKSFDINADINNDVMVFGAVGAIAAAEKLVKGEVTANTKGIGAGVLEGLKSGGVTKPTTTRELEPPSKDPETFGPKPASKESVMTRSPRS